MVKKADIKSYIKKEIVMFISLILAVISIFFVPVDGEYLGYVDVRTLGILLSLMLVIAGFRRLGIFAVIGKKLLGCTHSLRTLAAVLVLLCFFFSMVITNDVALITFVPFAIEILTMAGLQKYMIRLIVLQTVAANLGSMLTPIGNPQNVYLFSLSGMSMAQFFGTMLPYASVSLVLIVVAIFLLFDRKTISVPILEGTQVKKEDGTLCDEKKMSMYTFLFAICMAVVVRILPFYVALILVLLAVLIFDRGTIRDADYGLLLTFVFLFIFIGNIGRIPAISSFLAKIIQGHELIVTVAVCQGISNVPAAVLLQGFTSEIEKLLIGVNIGGLGTLIASMASLISYKFYCRTKECSTAKYLGMFTLINVIFLAVLLGTYRVMNG